MSILKASSIYDKDGGSNAVLYGVAAPTGGMNFRNRIINGDMRIDQRNAGAAVTAHDSFPVDRFLLSEDTDGAVSVQRDTVAPTGFVNSLKYTVTTADSSLGTTQFTCIRQRIEGYNVADLGWGTANAQTVTLSFFVRSSLTGTFGGSLANGAFNRSYPFTYTISSANTWEYKTVTVAGDTTGTWATDNSTGLQVVFGLGVGSTYSGTAGSWAASGYLSATGATSVIGTLNATFYITGVQLEAGSTATPFERRPYGTELALCQRYYEKSYNIGVVPGTTTSAGHAYFHASSDASNAAITVQYKVTKRTAATPSFWSPTGVSGEWAYSKSGGSGSVSAIAFGIGDASFSVYSGIGSSWVACTYGGHWAVSAEL